MDATCTRCEATLSDADRYEGPSAPEIGWEYYKCSSCGHQMHPQIVDADESPDSTSQTPSRTFDPVTSPHVDIDDISHLSEEEQVVYTIIASESADGEWADREWVEQTIIDELGVSDDTASNYVRDFMMRGLCYEPADDSLSTI